MGIKSIFLYRLRLRLTSFLEKTQHVLVNKYYSLKLSILTLNAADHLLYGPISKSDCCGDTHAYRFTYTSSHLPEQINSSSSHTNKSETSQSNALYE